MEPISFAKAQADTADARRHLLLGNGFSSGRFAEFGYPKLFEFAVRQDPSFTLLFPDPQNPNFEDAIREASAKQTVDRIRNALIRAVADLHPHYSLDLKSGERRSCRLFLREFIGSHRAQPGCVFSTNYDLLLHWVVSSQAGSPGVKQHRPLAAHDGFEGNGDWHEFADARVYYLHGAVHIWQYPLGAQGLQSGTEMIRYEWNGRTWLTTQIAERMAKGELPVFIAEGNGPAKRAAMKDRKYTKRALNRLKKALGEPESVLFTFGHSFGESDDHISDEIALGNIGAVYFGVYSARDRARVAQLATEWTDARALASKPPISVIPYDARTSIVWGDAIPPWDRAEATQET